MSRRLHSFEVGPDSPSGDSLASFNKRGDRTARASSRWPTTNDDNVNLKPSGRRTPSRRQRLAQRLAPEIPAVERSKAYRISANERETSMSRNATGRGLRYPMYPRVPFGICRLGPSRARTGNAAAPRTPLTASTSSSTRRDACTAGPHNEEWPRSHESYVVMSPPITAQTRPSGRLRHIVKFATYTIRLLR